MDVRAPLQVAAGLSAPAAASAVPNVSASVRNVLATIASATTTSDSQKQALVAATATAGQITDVNLAELALETVSSTGIFLRSTGSEGWPRWQVLTALRAYGLNLTEKQAAPAPAPDAQLAAQVQAQLDAVLREARNVSLAQVQAQAATPAPAVQQQAAAAQAAPAPRAATPAPQASPAPVAPAGTVDTLV